jgi:transposase
MLQPELKAARRLISKSRTPGGRLPANVRGEVIAAVEDAHASGMSYSACAQALGVAEPTLMRWRWRDRDKKLVSVRVQLPMTALTVHGPGGLRIEGLSLEDVAALLKRLA